MRQNPAKLQRFRQRQSNQRQAREGDEVRGVETGL
jgi:hypothetical protein